MSTQVQIRRGNTAQTAIFTGAVAELTVDTDKETVVVHDGSTAGGFPLARESALTANNQLSQAGFNHANSAFIQANSSFNLANGTAIAANTSSLTANLAFNHANSSFDAANTADSKAVTSGSYANSAFTTANTASSTATSAGVYANGAFDAANTADSKAITSGSYANSAFAVANNSVDVNLTQNNSITAAFIAANSAGVYANGAFATANNEAGVNLTQNNSITAGFTAANSAGVYANGAFARANNSLNANTGGSITGDISITGNLTVTGNTTYTNTITVLIGDNIIVLNADLSQSAQPTENAGIEIDRGAQPNSSFLWIETSGKWAANNGNTEIFLASEATLTSAFNTANAAFLTANAATATDTTQNNSITAAFLQANTPSYTANSAASYANSAFSRANNSLDTTTGGSVTGAITASGNVRADYVVANTAFASAAGLSKLELTDIGLAAIKVAGETYQFGASGIESNQGVFGGSFGGNRLSLNNETNLISNRYDIVKIQTGTDGTVANEFTFANNTFSAPGKINVASRVDFTGTGYAQPSFTTRSAGQKITLYPAISGSLVDYSIGIDGGALWTTVPAATTDYNFKWYGGETQIASLSGAGTLDVISANITSSNTSTSNTTGALKVTGGVGVRGNVSADGIIFPDNTRQTTAAVGGASIGDAISLAIALG
jgi:hypothetical protein